MLPRPAESSTLAIPSNSATTTLLLSVALLTCWFVARPGARLNSVLFRRYAVSKKSGVGTATARLDEPHVVFKQEQYCHVVECSPTIVSAVGGSS